MGYHQLIEHAAQLFTGAAHLVFKLLQLTADHVVGTATIALYLLRSQLIQVTGQSGLRDVDAVCEKKLG